MKSTIRIIIYQFIFWFLLANVYFIGITSMMAQVNIYLSVILSFIVILLFGLFINDRATKYPTNTVITSFALFVTIVVVLIYKYQLPSSLIFVD